MDDFKDIWGVIVLVAGMAIYIVKAAKKVREQMASDSEEPRHEELPQEDAEMNAEMNAHTKHRHQERIVDNKSSNKVSVQFTTLNDNTFETPEIKVVNNDPDNASDITSNAIGESHDSSTTADFDLRKAVIYSEILKTKFDR